MSMQVRVYGLIEHVDILAPSVALSNGTGARNPTLPSRGGQPLPDTAKLTECLHSPMAKHGVLEALEMSSVMLNANGIGQAYASSAILPG